MGKSKLTYLVLFIIGLLIIIYYDLMFSNTAISDLGALIAGIIISSFSGLGYLLETYYNKDK